MPIMDAAEKKALSSGTLSDQEAEAGILPSHGISIDLPDTLQPRRPTIIQHLSTPAYQSPLRHHRRTPSQHRPVKETLDARSEYTNSQDDGTAQHSINQYIIKEEIGRGSFGAVHLAVDQYGREYAVKEFSKSRLRKRAQSNILRRPHDRRRPGHLAAGLGLNSPLHRRSTTEIDENEEKEGPLYLIKEEIAIMKKLDHPNLVSLIEVLDDPDEDSLYMVLEMCKKGVVMKVGLDERADPYSSENCRCWFRDLILGIEYLHAQGVVHRDIKPDNLLLTEDDVLKIVDFGVSEMFEKQSEMMTAKSAGSPAFLPPELCVAKHGDISGKAADIWSMGVSLYCMRFGRIPFERPGVLELYEAIKKDDVDCSLDEEPNFRDLMNRVLEKDPKKRITMDGLREHPWVTNNGQDPLLSKEANIMKLVEPPTESEKNHAITGNIKNLLVVMKAVNKFKNLTWHKRPGLLSKILGQGHESRVVHPPESMRGSDSPNIAQATRSPHPHRTRSSDLDNRIAIETALVTEGVARRIEPDARIFRFDRVDSAVTIEPSRPGTAKESPSSTPLAPTLIAPESSSPSPKPTGDKGHARDPMEEERPFLGIGAGVFSEGKEDHDDEATREEMVAESPTAAEFDIYDTAYGEEVERIRKAQGEKTTIYLTRRVDSRAVYKKDDNMIGSTRASRGGLLGVVDAMKTRNQAGDGEYAEHENAPAVDEEDDIKKRSLMGIMGSAKDEASLRRENIGLKMKAQNETLMNTMGKKGINKEGAKEAMQSFSDKSSSTWSNVRSKVTDMKSKEREDYREEEI